MFLGVLCSPLAFSGYYPSSTLRARLSLISVVLFNPFVVTNFAIMAAKITGYYNDEVSMTEVLRQWLEAVSFGWNVWGAWGVPVGVFCVWLPAWIVAGFGVMSSFIVEENGKVDSRVKRVGNSVKKTVDDVKQVAATESSQMRKRKK